MDNIQRLREIADGIWRIAERIEDDPDPLIIEASEMIREFSSKLHELAFSNSRIEGDKHKNP